MGAQPREEILINNNWTFHLSDASSMEKDFSHGTEYFTYMTKIGATGSNKGPASVDFDDSSWQTVNLPHDWVVDLPYSGEASHSHGYKCVGWKYPENSVGWYRHSFLLPDTDRGRHIEVRFDGIFRDSEVFFNGIYLGHERSGYASSVYDLTPYANFGDENVLVVRADASLEEGWFYEGAGIYRDVTLVKTSDIFVPQFGVKVLSNWGNVDVTAKIANRDFRTDKERIVSVWFDIFDPNGNLVATSDRQVLTMAPYTDAEVSANLKLDVPHMWDLDVPYMYRMRTYVSDGSDVIDSQTTRFGIRDFVFDRNRGFVLNNRRVELVGVNLHQDAAGVGSAIPKELWRYRMQKLRAMGVNAVRCSHNPASPAMLDVCDEMGMLVIDENRLGGINPEQTDLLRRMIERDINHPCVMLWSLGNEEWYVESDPKGYDIFHIMSLQAKTMDPTRSTIYANSGGNSPLGATDVNGYNYLVQNNITADHQNHPYWKSIATEETSGCGTRGVSATVPEEGWMLSLNRSGVAADTRNGSDALMHKNSEGKVLNVIGRGWNYYMANKFVGGLFYWTGFDYRGEPNPMAWPATGSQFGILDYCGFPKDEAFYLEAQATNHTVLHLCQVVGNEVWVYTNCETVDLLADGRSLGKKSVKEGDYVSWTLPAGFKKLTARGYVRGRQIATSVYPDVPKLPEVSASKTTMTSDGQDVIVLDFKTGTGDFLLNCQGPVEILGWGNGNPGFKDIERTPGAKSMTVKPFFGRAQVILRSLEGMSGVITVSVPGWKKPLVLNSSAQ